MKKCLFLLVLMLALTGCTAQETLETVADDYIQSVAAVRREVCLELPETAVVSAIGQEETGKLWFCDGYTVTLQTMEAGDLDRTLRSTTGFSKDILNPLQTVRGDVKRYDCVWTAAGEAEPQVCRAAVLDDGSYHYVLTAMAGESAAGAAQAEIQSLFRSFQLNTSP